MATVWRRLAWGAVLSAFAGVARAAVEGVPISSIAVDTTGCVQIEVASTSDCYYVLYRQLDPNDDSQDAVSVTLGQDGTTMLTEPLGVYGSFDRYRVVRHRRDDPADTDADGIDDMAELANPVRLSPLNPALEVGLEDGAVSIPDRETFRALSYRGLGAFVDPHLENLEYLKFYIFGADTENPEVYFMNTKTHRVHAAFAWAVGILPGPGDGLRGQMRGQIVYHPHILAPNGGVGLYRFEFQPGDAYDFEAVQMAHELIAANMPTVRNNLAYYPVPTAALPRYRREKDLYDASRVAILLEDDIYANIGFLPLNTGEGYGLLRLMDLNERPGPRDIVMYEALPNEMPRVGGIITTVPQTPLSHVNLRAIQDHVPNAYIRAAAENETISALIGKHVRLTVEWDGYMIREATSADVEAHYAALRPAEPQFPVRDLSVTAITPLSEIGFTDSSRFGVKTANLATLLSFGFRRGVVPDGFGVSFYFYDEFMKYNGFYERAAVMLDDPGFQQDFDVQEEMLAAFRRSIRDGDMPDWMRVALAELQNSFAEGTSLRCRSSTNNEDLPGFSGAGLYTSKTQHPEEGHIAKSIKQVYAGLWNFRAFDARQFYRIDHFTTAMGVLVHPNFSNEQANGVAVTTDPLYGTQETYYLNTQLGEDLVTNPEALSIPEEILLSTRYEGGYTLVRPSNQTPDGRSLLSPEHLNTLRSHLRTIHKEFENLYDARDVEDFAMEIEYKITERGHVAIKQARPWVP